MSINKIFKSHCVFCVPVNLLLVGGCLSPFHFKVAVIILAVKCRCKADSITMCFRYGISAHLHNSFPVAGLVPYIAPSGYVVLFCIFLPAGLQNAYSN